MREALITPKAKEGKLCIQVLFQKLSKHVQVSETKKEGFEKVVLALIRYTVNTANHDVQVLGVRRMLEDIFEAVGELDEWKTKCCWPSKELPVQTLELHDMTLFGEGVVLFWAISSYNSLQRRILGSFSTCCDRHTWFPYCGYVLQAFPATMRPPHKYTTMNCLLSYQWSYWGIQLFSPTWLSCNVLSYWSLVE